MGRSVKRTLLADMSVRFLPFSGSNIMNQASKIIRWRWPLAAILVAGMSFGGWKISQSQASNPQQGEAKKEKPAPVYELSAADTGAISVRELPVHLQLHGTLVPARSATLKAKVPGTVQETLVEEGMAVKQGQILARLDAGDLQARVVAQQAAVDEARARLSLAQKNHTSNQALLKQKYISQNAYDTAQNSVELAEANLKSARAQLEIARISLADTVIRAPFSGVIAKRHLQAGDKASPDMPLFAIVNLDKMTLEANVPAAEIARVRLGQEVWFAVDGIDRRRFAGKVERINPNADAASRSLTVYVQVTNDGLLKGGMYARGAIAVEKSRAMPVLPLIALRSDGGKNVVYLVKNGVLQAQEVNLGLRNEEEGLAEVTAGLKAGDEVLLTKSDTLKPGTKVKLPQAAAKSAQDAPRVKLARMA